MVVAAISNQYTEFTHQITEDILMEMFPDLKSVETKQARKQEVATQEVSNKTEQSDLLGIWEGYIVANDKQVPIDLVFQEDGDIHVNMYAQFESMVFQTHRYKVFHGMLLNKWSSTNGMIRGWYNENIPGEHLKRCPQVTTLSMEYKNGKLMGTAVALASHPSWMHYGLSYYLELEKKYTH
jgi:hypothetical protein